MAVAFAPSRYAAFGAAKTSGTSMAANALSLIGI
jgi:hypothetical protein